MSIIANNHFFRRRWTMELFQSTIWSDIWPGVTFFSAFATMVTIITQTTRHNLAVSTELLTVAGVVLGLVINFRTSSANERFEEGAQAWTNIKAASRTMAELIWLHVPNERVNEFGAGIPPLQVIIEKKTMINLVHAFAVSTKHLLRDEPGVFYEDLYPSVALLPKYATEVAEASNILPLWHIRGGRRMTDPNAVQRQDTLLSLIQLDDPPLKPARMPPEITIYDYCGPLRLGRFLCRKFLEKTRLRPKSAPKILRKKRIAYSEIVESTVPLELHLILSNYAEFILRNNYVEEAITVVMAESLEVLQTSLARLEVVCNNPLPFAYQTLLRLCLWLYLLFLPFQLIATFGYITIPATTFVAFLLVGFLEIGQEIENPFNYGLNDLDLDMYCDTIKRNLHEITAHSLYNPDDFIYSDQNQPFAPLDCRGAKSLISSPDGEYRPANSGDPDGIKELFVKNWRHVDAATRESSRVWALV